MPCIACFWLQLFDFTPSPDAPPLFVLPLMLDCPLTCAGYSLTSLPTVPTTLPAAIEGPFAFTHL